jgi:pyruvate, orthophosphate dikinase
MCAAAPGGDRRGTWLDSRYPAVVLLTGAPGWPREILGDKGHGIDVMRRHGLPVPPAFCITTEVGAQYFADPGRSLDTIWDGVLDAMTWLESQTSCTFGHGKRPLLVSVRSSAAQSMPGILHTVLGVGMDEAVEDALGATATAEFARDTRSRFRRSYLHRVFGDEDAYVPDHPIAQLRGAIETVFKSWNAAGAAAYRNHHGLEHVGGTGVVVQAMVFGNRGANSGSGVLFSSNPMTGASEPFGEWLTGAPGEDVVSGALGCEPVTALRDAQPGLYQQLMAAARTLERLCRDVQDIEFTVEEGRLWLLQTRVAKRSAQAAVRLALQLRRDGLIDDAEALSRVSPAQVETLLLPGLQPETRLAAGLLAEGLPACPGVVSGRAYTDVDEAVSAAEANENVILVRATTSPDDVPGMLAARGIVTEVGGATCHAAVLSRELGRPAVVGCGTGVADALSGRLITVDGTKGEVRQSALTLSEWSEADIPELRELADIARDVSPLRAHTAGDFPRLETNSVRAVRDAIAAGYTDVVSPSPLITMLTALRSIADSASSLAAFHAHTGAAVFPAAGSPPRSAADRDIRS